MNNNWLVVVFVALVSLFNILFAAPAATSSSSTQQQEDDGIFEYYDQRQNGTENIRIDMNGVVIVVSPLEALLAAASLLDPSLFGENLDDGFDFFKKQNKLQSLTTLTPERNNIRTSTEKSSRKKGSKLRIGNILTPLLRRKNNEQ